MHKEIHEQPRAVADTLEGRLAGDRVLEQAFGPQAMNIFNQTQQVQIIASGTSYHAGLVAKHWFEYVGVPCEVEVGSEYRYRRHAPRGGTLLVTISQSGETADTLAALVEAQRQGIVGSLGGCNTPESSLVRESDLSFMTHSGPEIGVASTKTFTAAMTGLMMLALVLSRRHGFDAGFEAHVVKQLRSLPSALEKVLEIEDEIAQMAKAFGNKANALFLARGAHYPIALEGALKLKELSYIHAEGYPAAEMKHGPISLIDDEMPVVALMPRDDLYEKMLSNVNEVKARGGTVIAVATEGNEDIKKLVDEVIYVPEVSSLINPVLMAVPMQLLAYHIALWRGCDIDQPRNLAKSVTVE